MRKRIFGIAAAALLCCSVALAGCSKGRPAGTLQEGAYVVTEKGTPEQYDSLYFNFLGGKDVMPIGGFYGPYTTGGSANGFVFPDLMTEKYYKLIADAGVNTIVYSKDTELHNGAAILKGLELGETYGIGTFVGNSQINAAAGRDTTFTEGDTLDIDMDALSSLVAQYSNYGSFLGLHGIDEPFWYQLDGVKAVTDLYNEMQVGDTVMYMNTLGYSVTDLVRGGWRENITVDQYYGKIFDKIKPPFLSATGYYYTEKDTPDTELSLMFSDLSAVRKLAKQYGVPVWRMLQAGGQWNDASEWIPSVDPYPAEGELLFDVNIALAYGCKAIQYFPLVQPLHFAYADPQGTYDFNRSGIIGAAGNVTQWYYYVQKANKQIAAIDHVLMNAESMGIIASGDNAKALARAEDEGRDDILKDGKFRQLTKVSGADCYVGCFDYKGGTALYVVNYSRTSKNNVTLSFDDNYGFDVIQRAQSVAVMGEELTLTLEAGEGVLVTLR